MHSFISMCMNSQPQKKELTAFFSITHNLFIQKKLHYLPCITLLKYVLNNSNHTQCGHGIQLSLLLLCLCTPLLCRQTSHFSQTEHIPEPRATSWCVLFSGTFLTMYLIAIKYYKGLYTTLECTWFSPSFSVTQHN
jgi:hypothetical protein